MPPRIAKLAGLGAFAACGGFVAVFALLVWITRPAGAPGLDPTLRFLTWFTVAGVLLSLMAVHIVLGRQLLALARGEAQPL